MKLDGKLPMNTVEDDIEAESHLEGEQSVGEPLRSLWRTASLILVRTTSQHVYTYFLLLGYDLTVRKVSACNQT